MAIHIKTPEEIAGLRIAGRLASELLDYLTPFVKPGITTGELDKLAYDYTVNVQKCIPACLGYQPEGMTPYPATTCISINHVVCHGIPGEKKLKHGDIVNIDVTSIKDGFHEEPHVHHFPINHPTPKFVPGMVFTIEPMVNAGRYGVTMLGDGWTVVTRDRSLSAQWEHMVLVTETGYDILPCSAGTPEPPDVVKGGQKPAGL